MRALRVLGKAILTTVVFFLLVEVALRAAYAGRNALVRYVPLPYVVGDDYGPVPPWLDNLLILRPDPLLIWRNIPNARRTYVDIFTPVRADRDRLALLRRFLPWLPVEFRANPVWSIALNEEGFRSAPFSASKRLGVLRIACIGDSWTFGMNVNQDETYPSRVAAMLGRQTPPRSVEVMNFGTLGYTSFQGLQVLKTYALDLQPDVVIIGFGMNDSDVAGYRDKDVLTPSPPVWRDRVKAITSHSESLALMKYFALALRFQPKNMGEFLKADAKADQGKSNATVSYDDMEAWTRVSPRDYEQNLREMIRLSRARNARVILLDNELWPESPYRPVLRTLSRDEHVPLVDSLQLIADERAKIERGMETRFHVAVASAAPAAPAANAAPGKPVEAVVPVVFRVSQGAYPVPARLSIVGNHPALGAFSPNTIAMHDDGTGGDEHAGDHVWSYRAMLPAGARFRYVYTNSGAPGQWEGLDLPHVREVLVTAQPGGGPMSLPVETFGRLYMQADNWHTDAAGYELIAKAIVDALK
jgi:lysophospholipase L1-like esterase